MAAEKLSTTKIKELIGTWLSSTEARNNLQHHSEISNPNGIMKGWGGAADKTELQYALDLWEAPTSVQTSIQLEEYIWKLWCDGSRWKREEKRKLKDEAEDTFSEYEYIGELKATLPGNRQERRRVPSFPCDMLGKANQALVEKYFNEPKLAEKCVYRMFVPDNQLADSYRLEVITTHDDTEVVGWWVTVD